MWITEHITTCHTYRQALKSRVAFVPTMGALHDGHVSLMHLGRQLADHVIVSIFVNPIQFNDPKDFTVYPRTLELDLARCEQAGVSGVFCPTVDAMYPGHRPACEVNVPSLANDLEGKFRPGHFAGVCRVVAKLFNIVQPTHACFGMKDYQQLRVVQAMVADLDMPIEVVGLPTVREADGLAMSSRNVRIAAEDRPRALSIYKALLEAKRMVEVEHETSPEEIEGAMQRILQAHRLEVEYAAVRHPATLAKLDCVEPAVSQGVVALIAARLPNVRLIDNLLIGHTAS